MKEKNSGSVGRLPNRPVLWWKLIQIMKQMKKIELEQINVLSEEDRPVCSIVIPKEGAISPSHNPSLNKSMLTIQYGICYNFILHCYLSARSGSSTKGRIPNIRYFVAKPSIVLIYAFFERLSQGFQRKPSCFHRAFNEGHPVFVELSSKAILLL